MNEKAHIFFTLLNEAYKEDASEKLEWINVISVPHVKESDAKKIIRGYKQIATNMADVAQDNNNFSGIELLLELE